MNATRAATIRLRSSFDGAVSLGRVQTPTLAILARREEEIRAFKPEPYWIVDAGSRPFLSEPGGALRGPLPRRRQARDATAEEAAAVVAACEGQTGEITKLEKSERKERVPLLYDLTSLQRDANTRFGFTARRTLGAAQRLYEEHKALTYPRTNSRWLTGDMILEIRPTAARRPAARVPGGVGVRLGLEKLPLAARRQRPQGHRPPRDHPDKRRAHPVDKMSDDDRRIYDLVVRRFLAVFHPDAVFENTRVETTVATHVFRTRGKLMLVPGWRGVYGETADVDGDGKADEDEGREQQLPRLELGEAATVRRSPSRRRRPTAAPLHRRLAAGRDGDGRQARRRGGAARGDEGLGIGTPATRAAIIERLLQVGYIERDGRAIVVTEKGLNVIRLLGEHALTSPLTGEWEHRLARIETGEDSREAFMGDIVKFTEATVGELDTKLKDVRIPRANLGPCPVCGHDIVENRKGYSCWARDDPGCGFVIWKSKTGKTLPIASLAS